MRVFNKSPETIILCPICGKQPPLCQIAKPIKIIISNNHTIFWLYKYRCGRCKEEFITKESMEIMIENFNKTIKYCK